MRRRLQVRDRGDDAAGPDVGRLTMARALSAGGLALALATLAPPGLAQVTQNLGGASVTMAMSGRRELAPPVNSNAVWQGPRPTQPSAAVARGPAQPQQPNAQGGAAGRRLLHARANDALQPTRSAN